VLVQTFLEFLRNQGLLNGVLWTTVLANGLRGNSRLAVGAKKGYRDVGNQVLAIPAASKKKSLVGGSCVCREQRLGTQSAILSNLNSWVLPVTCSVVRWCSNSRIHALVEMMRVNTLIRTIRVHDRQEDMSFARVGHSLSQDNRLRPRVRAIEGAIAYRAG
jgi:hypothetical protein